MSERLFQDKVGRKQLPMIAIMKSIAFQHFEPNDETPLFLFALSDGYYLRKEVQQACRFLERLGKPVTVAGFLSIDPSTYLGHYQVGEVTNQALRSFRLELLEWMKA